MLRVILLAMVGGLAFSVHAEEKTCAVKGMHCAACVEMVQGKVCEEGKYAKCEVKITNQKKETGQIHMVTKDANAVIDEKNVGAAVKDAGYTLEKCTKHTKAANKARG